MDNGHLRQLMEGLKSMNAAELVQSDVLEKVTASIPKAFWVDVRGAINRSYSDIFQEVKHSAALLEEQKQTFLYQARHYRMEFVLKNVAKAHELECSTTLVDGNGCNYYVYTGLGTVGMTQSYVKSMNDMPGAATYWKTLARNHPFPRLDLHDEPAGLLLPKSVYGMLVHTPVGKAFMEEHQKLGMIQFCVPAADSKSWAVELSLQEIISAYESQAVSEIVVEPKLKSINKNKDVDVKRSL